MLSRRGLPALGLTALLGLSAARAHASPEDVFGFGPRSSAMGATGAAIGQGYEAVYSNPALLSLSHQRALTLGFVSAAFDLRAQGLTSTNDRLSYGPLHGSVIGATLPVPFGGALKDRITIGLGFFTPLDLVVRGRILYPETPQFPIADRTQSVAVQAGVGIDLGHGIRIGGGFAALAALSGSVLVATDASGRIGTVVEDTLVASYGPIVGVSYDLGDAYRIGATFRGTLIGRFNVVINVRDLGDLVVPPLNISGVAQYDPWQVALEVARVKKPWRAALGATFKRWSAYPGPVNATVRCPWLDPDSFALITDPCGALVPAPPRYTDTVAVRAGVERTFDPAPGVELSSRGGIFVEPSPAPPQEGEGNLYDNTRVALSLGYGLALGPPWPSLNLDFFQQLQVLVPRTHDKAASVPADNPAGPSVVSQGVIVAGGMTAGVRF